MRDRSAELGLRGKRGIVVDRMLVAGERGKLGEMLGSQRRRFTAEHKTHGEIIGEELLGSWHAPLRRVHRTRALLPTSVACRNTARAYRECGCSPLQLGRHRCTPGQHREPPALP